MQNQTPFKICPACGQPALLKDLECLKCGHNFRFDLNDAKAASGIPVSQPPRPKRRPSPLHWAYSSRNRVGRSSPWLDTAGWILVLFMIAACIYSARRILAAQARLEQDAGGQSSASQSSSPPTGGGPLLPAAHLPGAGPAEETPVTISSEPSQPPAAPGDTQLISDYLRFLQELDGQRIAVQSRQAAALAAASQVLMEASRTAGAHNSAYSTMKAQLARVAAEWDALTRVFHAKPAPASCQPLAGSYSDALGKASAAWSSTVTRFIQALDALGSYDPSQVGSILATLQSHDGGGSDPGEIDAAFRQADGALAELCNRYHLAKDFRIAPDTSGR